MRAKKSKHISKDNIIDVIYENPSHFGSLNENYITSGILQYLRTSALISSPRLINILVDISLYPKVSKKLVLEQSEIINKYGKSISRKALSDMVYLDATIKESLRLSSPANFAHRYMDKDYFLSNGIVLKQGSTISFSSFTHNRNMKLFGPSIRSFIPERHLESSSKLEDSGIDDTIWGIRNKCPYISYSSSQLKVIIALIVRKYYILNSINGLNQSHPGYKNIITTIPDQSVIYLKKHYLFI
ncbi:Cytochrome P450 4e3 [Smittium culicis]|uniref:Cytochrome P450 4e3 n=1 Tax=Smittium culicis TaxID=133412 RepID=A0A1R1XA16_9FUNG|nr:Cytochrome P450 4e3 [Smittium culicis]